MTRIMAGAAALMVAFGLGGTAQAQDAAAGEKVFKKCAACHKVEDGKNGVGPHLHAIVGRAVGTVQGYKYSEAMAAYGATGAVWDAANLDHYLLNPKEHVKGTKMSFAGLKKDDERANVIAYLATLK